MTMEGKELRNWREKHKLTQLELAEHLHVKRETVTRWEIEMRKIPPFLFLALEGLENLLADVTDLKENPTISVQDYNAQLEKIKSLAEQIKR